MCNLKKSQNEDEVSIEILESKRTGLNVRARELYKCLDIKEEWESWTSKHIRNNELFEAEKDYREVNIKFPEGTISDFFINLDLAKHITIESDSEFKDKYLKCFNKFDK